MTTNLKKTVLTAAVLASVVSAAPVAFAQVSLNATVNANTTVGNTVSGSANTNASVKANANANADASTSRGNSNATTSLGQKVSAIVSGGENKNAAADIDAQIKILRDSDPNVADVSADDDSVTVQYKIPGRFLGLFSVDTTAYVTTDTSGKTKVHYPWYTFVTSVDDDSLKADLEARNWAVTSSNKAEVAASIQAAMKAWADMHTSASTDTSVSAK